MEDTVSGLLGTRVLSRAVMEHKLELGIVPTRFRNMVG